MRNWQKLGATIAGMLLLLSMLAACGPTTSTTGGNSGTSAKKGGSIVNGLYEEPDSLIQNLTNETYSVLVDQAIWAPLWYGDPQGNMHAGIVSEIPSASNGDVSSDLTTFTIKLKPNLKWSDGSPLTAADCAFTYNYMAQPAYANTAAFPTTDPSDPVGFVSATAVDTNTFKVQFKNPLVEYLATFADGVSSCMPKEVFGSIDASTLVKSPQAFQPTVVSGPFMIKERVQGDHITVVRNPNYYQGPDKPYLDQITFKIITDQNTILTGLQNGTIDDSWFLDITKLDTYKAIQGYTTYIDKYPAGFEMLDFNFQNQFLADPVVRKAITQAIDTTQLITQLYNGAAAPTCDDHPGQFAHEPSLIPCYKADPTAAKNALLGDGFTLDSNGYMTKGGKELELRWATTNKAVRKQTQLIGQAALKAIGIKIDIQNYDANTYFGVGPQGILWSGNYDIGEFAESGSYAADDHTLFSSDETPDKGGSNYGHYSNPTVDQAEKDQLATADIAKRKAAFHTIDTQVLADNAVMYLYSAANISVYNNRLQNYQPSAIGPSETWNVWDWWVTH